MDAYEELANKILDHHHIARCFDWANQDRDSMVLLITDILRQSGCFNLPKSIQEALNSGSGIYKP